MVLDLTSHLNNRLLGRLSAQLRLIGVAAMYQPPGMPVQHLPPVTAHAFDIHTREQR
jgi:hypothetical protein